ncbi:retrotransposon protein, putative, ty3-gypsy subclass [Tanacetum coccineum]
MRELREDTFSGNKNDDAHEHVERILDIVSLFNIPGVTHDAVMLCVFPITLIGAAKRWLEEIHNFNQEGDETLYQAWEMYNDLLYKCPTHNLNSHQKVNMFYKGLDIMTRQVLDSQGTIPNKTLAQKLKVNVHVIQVGCENCGGAHFNKECPFHKEVKNVEEVKNGEFGRSFPNNGGNKGIYYAGPLGYYTRMDNQPPFGKRNPSLTEIITKYMEESAKKEAEHDEWLRKFQEKVQEETEELEEIKEVVAHHEPAPREVTPINLPIVSYYEAPYEPSIPFLKRLKQHVEEALVHKAMESLKRIKINRPLLKEIRQTDDYAKHIKNLVVNKSRTSKNKDVKMNTRCLAILQNQLPSKEEDPWSFILPCSIGKLTFNALAHLGATISIMPLSMFKRLRIGELKPINMTIEMADRTKNMVEDLRMPIILGRPLLATAHAKVDIFRKSISLEVANQKVVFKTKNNPNKTLIESVCAIRNEKGVTNDDLMKIDHDLQELDENQEGMIDMNIDLAQEMNPNTEEDCEDLENFKEENMELILDKLDTVLE